MNKGELVKVVAEKAELSQKQATVAVAAVFDTIKNALVEGDTVQLLGFGTFSIKERAAREGRNPSTGEFMKIPAKKVPAFKASKTLKEAIVQ